MVKTKGRLRSGGVGSCPYTIFDNSLMALSKWSESEQCRLWGSDYLSVNFAYCSGNAEDPWVTHAEPWVTQWKTLGDPVESIG
jgi:hypothetical protein